jgi:hypothetical protein
MTPLLDLIEALLKNLSDRIALAIFFASGLALLLMLFPWQVATLIRSHWEWPFLGLLLSLCYLPTRYVFAKVSEFSSNRTRNERLHHLTRQEKKILAPYIDNDFRSRRMPFMDPVAKGLADDGVLYTPDVARDVNGGVAYNIHDWARLYLKKNPNLVGRSEGPKAGDL